MGKPPIMYQSWKSLDPAKRYCLADTMVLLQIYRRDLRLTAMTDSVLDGRTLLIIPEVMRECRNVFYKEKPDTASAEFIYGGDESGEVYEVSVGAVTREDIWIEPKSRNEFDELLSESLRMWWMKYTAVRPERDTYNASKKKVVEKPYPNKKGVPLSHVDCLLLCLASENSNVEILTDDMHLTMAIDTECGPGRASNVLAAYFGRLNMTAHFLGKILNVGYIDCRLIRNRIEYHVMNQDLYGTRGSPNALKPRPSSQPEPSMIFAVDISSGGMSGTYGKASRGSEHDNALMALMNFLDMVVLDWHCACEDPTWSEFDKRWHDVEHDFDTMKITSKTCKPYYETAKYVLNANRKRYCACGRPDAIRLHEEFKKIIAKDDSALSKHIFDAWSASLQKKEGVE